MQAKKNSKPHVKTVDAFAAICSKTIYTFAANIIKFSLHLTESFSLMEKHLQSMTKKLLKKLKTNRHLKERKKIMNTEHSSLTNEQVQNMTNHINARSQSQSYSVSKRYDDGSIENLYECIPDIHAAWALAQYAMEKNRKNENDGIIIMYPGYNDAELKAVNNFTAFAENLAGKYAVDEEDRRISKPKCSLSSADKKRIKAFEDWINENTENGVTSIPENLTRNILSIVKQLAGDC